MKLETKFDIGERVWVVEVRNDSVKSIDVLSGIITGISVDKDSTDYFFNEWGFYYKETDLIKYNDKEAFVNKIIELDNKIKEEK